MNKSGITPVEFNVLIKQDDVTEKTEGGLIMPESAKDRERHSTTRGVIVAVSPLSFNEDVWPVNQERPKAGDRVAFAQHSGTFIKGTDDKEYRLVKDKDVMALIEDK